MVDLSGGPDGPIEHGFSNTVFIIPAIVVIGLADRQAVLDQLDGRGRIDEGVEIPENFIHEVPEPPGSLSSILESLDNIQGLSDQERLELRDELLKAMAGEPQDATTATSDVFAQTIVFLVALSIIVSILAFFGLKLYRSLSERERKREEKRRLKQQKKKK